MDLRDVVLVVRVSCSVCSGSGEVQSEEWDHFDTWLESEGLVNSAADHIERFFLEMEGFDSVPAMKRECGACDAGRVESELAPEVLIAAVMQRVPTAVIPRRDLDEAADILRETLTQAALKSKGLADPDETGGYLRVVQESAEALRSVTDLLEPRGDR